MMTRRMVENSRRQKASSTHRSRQPCGGKQPSRPSRCQTHNPHSWSKHLTVWQSTSLKTLVVQMMKMMEAVDTGEQHEGQSDNTEKSQHVSKNLCSLFLAQSAISCCHYGQSLRRTRTGRLDPSLGGERPKHKGGLNLTGQELRLGRRSRWCSTPILPAFPVKSSFLCESWSTTERSRGGRCSSPTTEKMSVLVKCWYKESLTTFLRSFRRRVV